MDVRIDHYGASKEERFYIYYLKQRNIKFRFRKFEIVLSNGDIYKPSFYLTETNEYVDINLQKKVKSDLHKVTTIGKKELIKLGFSPSKSVIKKKIKIRDTMWTIVSLADEPFQDRFGDCLGITVFEEKTIYLGRCHITPELIAHELGHAYFHSCLTSTTNMGPEDIEEVFCEIIANYGRDIVDKADVIFQFLNNKLNDHYDQLAKKGPKRAKGD